MVDAPGGGGGRRDLLGGAVLVAGLAQLGLGVWQAAAPGSFFSVLGGFGSPNDHYVRDVATLYLALGLLLLVAVRVRAWRAPALFFSAVQYGLHALNHVLDVTKAHPSWVGPFDAATLGAAAVAFALLFRQARKETAAG